MSSKFIIEDHVLIRYEGNDAVIVVPDGVTRIEDNAFAVHDFAAPPKIKSITLPATVTEVGRRAFANLKKMTSYTAPAGIVYDNDAFYQCAKLADEAGFVIIDNSAMAYFGQAETVTVPEGTHTLRESLFRKCGELTSVRLPASLRTICAGAFAECESLESISLPDGMTEIGYMAFSDCTRLKGINLPASLVRLGDNVFSGCRAMADEQGFVMVNNVLYSYFGTEKDVIIPEGVDTIAAYAFENSNITSVKLPSTLKTLGSAFTDCKMLSEIIKIGRAHV